VSRQIADKMKASRPAVLVLGAGFIGSAVARALIQRGCVVTVLTRTPLEEAPRVDLTGARVVVGDAADRRALVAALADATEVVYAVGSASPVEAALDPLADIARVVPPLSRLLEVLRRRPGVRLTFISSGGAVYGNQDRMPISETAEARPINSYGLVKLMCERHIQAQADEFGVRSTILRVSNAYGPGQSSSRGQGVVARLLRNSLTGEPTPMFGLRTAIRDYVYISDVADATAQIVCLRDAPQVLNVGSGAGHRLIDVLEIVRAVSGRDIPIVERPPRDFDIRANVLDVTALRGLIAYEPMSLESGVTATWQRSLSSTTDVMPARPTGTPRKVSMPMAGATANDPPA
jgi:UDP-glucose 4-epimerase